MASLDMAASSVWAEVDMGRLSFPRGQIENWGDSGAVVTSPRPTPAPMSTLMIGIRRHSVGQLKS